jgi:hypothetical protein
MNKPAIAQAPAPTDPVAAALAAAGTKKQTAPLVLKRFQTLNFSARDWGNTHGITVPAGTTLEDVLAPEYWALVAPSLRVGDWIRVLTDDSAWEALLTVRQVSGPGAGRQNNRALIAELEFWTFDEPLSDTATRPTTHRVEYKGTHLKWCVVRASDGEVVKEGCGTEDEARAAMQALLRVQK